MVNKKEARILIEEIQHLKDNGMSDDFIDEYVVKKINRVVKNCSIPAVVGRSEQLFCYTCRAWTEHKDQTEKSYRCTMCGNMKAK